MRNEARAGNGTNVNQCVRTKKQMQKVVFCICFCFAQWVIYLSMSDIPHPRIHVIR